MLNFGINKLLEKAGGVQEKMKEVEAELEKILVTGESGAGMVRVTMNGKKIVRDIHIEDEAMESGKAVVEDLIKAAVNQASQNADEKNKEKLSGLIQGFDLSKIKSLF